VKNITVIQFCAVMQFYNKIKTSSYLAGNTEKLLGAAAERLEAVGAVDAVHGQRGFERLIQFGIVMKLIYSRNFSPT